MIVYPIGRCTVVLLLSGGGQCFRHPRDGSASVRLTRTTTKFRQRKERYHAYPTSHSLDHPEGLGHWDRHNKPPIPSHRTTFAVCSTLPHGASRTNVEYYVSIDLGLRCSLVACQLGVGGFGILL